MTSNISSSTVSASPADTRTTFAGLAPLVAIVFCGFLGIAASFAALSLDLHDRLGLAPSVIGLVIGLQSLATVMTRHQSGTLCDHRGPRFAVSIGLPVTAASGALYLVATIPGLNPSETLGLIVLGRLVMGLGESLFITGAMSWGIARIGAARTGKVMSWQGIAMYGAVGLGAPLGLAAYHAVGFYAVGILTIASPLVASLVALGLPAEPGRVSLRVPFYRVLGLIWRPGLVLALATTPFAALSAFLALDYAARDWGGAGAALGAFGGCYVFVRLILAHLPDRWGGVRVAAVSLAIEAIGQALVWLAPSPTVALLGACLTGLGFSLIFPSMGVEAMKSVSPDQRGRAVGNFIAFFDVAIGLTAPIVGLAAGRFGYASAFLVGLLATLTALALLRGVKRGPR